MPARSFAEIEQKYQDNIADINRREARELRSLEIKHWLWRIKFYGGWAVVGCLLIFAIAWMSTL